METLFDIEFDAKAFMNNRRGDDRKTLWDKLVASSKKLDGAGCDGFLLSEVETYVEELLTRLDDSRLYQIWLETENAFMALEDGFGTALRYEMVHDIGIDVVDHIVESICEETTKKKRKASR